MPEVPIPPARGYLALAPDLYRGRSWVRCLRGVSRQLHAGSGPAFDGIATARELLAARVDSTGKTGVIGFCMGGAFALLSAPRDRADADGLQARGDAGRVATDLRLLRPAPALTPLSGRHLR